MIVFSQVLGQSQAKEVEVAVDSTVSQLRNQLALGPLFIAKVKGLDASDTQVLKAFDVVVWAEKVKGN